MTAYAKDKVDHISSITFHYGQTHSKEVDCAVEVARLMEVEHEMHRHLISVESCLVFGFDQS